MRRPRSRSPSCGGRNEIGRVDPTLLADRVDGPRLLLLGGRSWRVTWTDWKRRRCFVEPAEGGGRARWLSDGVGGLSFQIARSMRDVLLGAEVPVTLTRRAAGVLAGLRSDGIGRVHADGLVISRREDDLRWWTWAGYRVNATLKATLGAVADEAQRVDDLSTRLRPDLRPLTWRGVVDAVRDRPCLPEVDEKALAGLKFSEALPRHLAVATLRGVHQSHVDVAAGRRDGQITVIGAVRDGPCGVICRILKRADQFV